MKKNFSFICIFLLTMVLAMPAMAAKSKYTPLTKKYKNASLEQVLADLEAKTGYKLSYVPDDLDLNQRVNMSFKETPAKTVLKKVLDKNIYDITSKKGVITIAKKPAPPVTYEVKATTPSKVIDDSIMTVQIWQDTTYSIACKMITKEVKQEDVQMPEITSKGHYVQAFLGGGYSKVGYKIDGGKDKGGFGGMLQAQYAYYFHENWGVTAGLGFELYSSKGVLNNTYTWENQADSENELYNHISQARDWTEKQMIGILNIPIGVQCQYPVIKDKLKIFAGAGFKLGLPVLTSQKLISGELQHTGYYPMWNMTMDEQVGNLGNKHDFYTEQASDFTIDKQMKCKSIAVAAMADAGVAIPVADQIDVLVGAYFDHTLNNIKDGQQMAMGWQQPAAEQDYRKHTFMESYQGMTATSKAIRPWEVGIKVGVQWHHRQKAPVGPPFYERIQTCDTTYTLTQRSDTTYKPQPEAAKQIVRLMEKAVIWFDLDKWEPKLEPADIIDRIAEILIANPEQRILVNGHASREGQAEHNQMLSDKRAEAVTNLLLEKGVNSKQITTKGYSSEIEYVSENEQADRSKHNISLDRRVEIIPVIE